MLQQVTVSVMLTVDYPEGLDWETAKALAESVFSQVDTSEADVKVKRVTRLEWAEAD